MFAFPVTIPVRTDGDVYSVDATVNIDDVLKVVPLCDLYSVGIESMRFYSCLPATEIVMIDGRKLPVLETAATINRYLDAYRDIENFFTSIPRPDPNKEMVVMQGEKATGRGVVIPLFRNRSCASSEAPTPD